MVRKHFHLPPEQIELLHQTALEQGISKSELVRKIIDKYFADLKASASASREKVDNG